MLVKSVNDTTTVKVGIVGQGLVGPSHYKGYQTYPGLKSLLSVICPENVRSPLPKPTFLRSTPPIRICWPMLTSIP